MLNKNSPNANSFVRDVTLFVLASASIVIAVATAGCWYGEVYVSDSGCTPRGVCPYGSDAPRNFYYQPENVVVVQPNAGASIILHELAHMWQGRLCPRDDIALTCWLDTPEGRDFPNTPYPWSIGEGKIEDMAWVFAAHYLGWELDSARSQWAERWLP